VFTISLYEIDRLIDDITSQESSPDPLSEQRSVQAFKAKELASITQDLAHAENQTHQPPLEEDKFV
jgi:hypothetical protein